MTNLRIDFPLVDGSSFPFEFETGKQLIQTIAGDDLRPPPRSMVIQVTADDGRVVVITVPYSDSAKVHVSFDGSD